MNYELASNWNLVTRLPVAIRKLRNGKAITNDQCSVGNSASATFSNRMTSERSHVYRKMMKIKGSTPAGVVCSAEAACFYKHTNPPGLKRKEE
jgi:hypothetical protein